MTSFNSMVNGRSTSHSIAIDVDDYIHTAQTFILFESDINGVKITILWKIYSTQYSFNAFLLLLTLTLPAFMCMWLKSCL